MKRFLLILLALLLLIPSALADVTVQSDGSLIVTPGIYEVGKDIPGGYYDVRMKGLKFICSIRYASMLKDDGTLDMDSLWAWDLNFMSTGNYWQGCHPNILISDGCYLEIMGSYCTFYPISQREF